MLIYTSTTMDKIKTLMKTTIFNFSYKCSTKQTNT